MRLRHQNRTDTDTADEVLDPLQDMNAGKSRA